MRQLTAREMGLLVDVFLGWMIKNPGCVQAPIQRALNAYEEARKYRQNLSGEPVPIAQEPSLFSPTDVPRAAAEGITMPGEEVVVPNALSSSQSPSFRRSGENLPEAAVANPSENPDMLGQVLSTTGTVARKLGTIIANRWCVLFSAAADSIMSNSAAEFLKSFPPLTPENAILAFFYIVTTNTKDKGWEVEGHQLVGRGSLKTLVVHHVFCEFNNQLHSITAKELRDLKFASVKDYSSKTQNPGASARSKQKASVTNTDDLDMNTYVDIDDDTVLKAEILTLTDYYRSKPLNTTPDEAKSLTLTLLGNNIVKQLLIQLDQFRASPANTTVLKI